MFAKDGRFFYLMSAKSAMTTRTVEVSSKELESAIEVLSSASQALQLTRFEKLSYRALMVCADVATASFFAALLSIFIAAFLGAFEEGGPLFNEFSVKSFAAISYFVFFFVFAAAILVGIVSLVLNIALLRKTFRERARLKQLGLSSLSQSLLKESRRGRWENWVRRVAFIGTVILWLLAAVFFFIGVEVGEDSKENLPIIFAGLFLVVVPGLLIAARYLRNQRERIDLTVSADELRRAFQSLRQRSDAGAVSVPAELLAKSAKIETVQIAEERKDAILESATSRPAGYAIAFDRDAAEQRATLSVADRVELEDLVAQLSTDGTRVEPQLGTGQGRTKSNRVEIDYIIDNASSSIRVVAVRHIGEVSHATADGGGHA
jgi:hypothetical protein